MNVVVMTSKGSLFGKKLINELMARQIRIVGVVVVRQGPGYFWRLFRYVQRRVGVVDAVWFTVRRVVSPKEKPLKWGDNSFIADYEQMGLRIVETRGTNSDETAAALKALEPGVVLLGQTGILKEKILSIPKRGTLNAHPGLLPDYRGIDCALWAIRRDEPEKLGCSVHWVDAGVDTGEVIVMEPYVLRGDETIETLKRRIEDQAVRLMGRAVEWVVQGNAIGHSPQKKEDGRQYYKMSRKDERIVQRKLAEWECGHAQQQKES